jgi:hypothetical protein
MLYLTVFIPKTPTRKGGFMPLSHSTPLHLWAFSLEHGIWLWRNSGLTSANLADVISEFMTDHADGVIVAIVADPSTDEIAQWEERASEAFWSAEEAKRNESPTVTALDGAMENLFGLR